MRIAVTGRHGQVVQSLISRAAEFGHEIVALGRPDLDLNAPESVLVNLAACNPDAIVSAAAYTAVDKAESEPELAFAVNAVGAEAVARAAAALGVPLVHLSTDYVFSGSNPVPYVETDVVNPLGIYGSTKLAGEVAVWAAHPENSVILRTAWVYSQFGSNFLKTMLRLGAERNLISVVANQFGNPTSALDIADGILQVLQNLKSDPAPALRGIFHMTATGDASWALFAEKIFEVSAQYGGPTAVVTHISAADYPTPACRPANSRLNCARLESQHGIRLGEWQPSAAKVISALVDQKSR